MGQIGGPYHLPPNSYCAQSDRGEGPDRTLQSITGEETRQRRLAHIVAKFGLENEKLLS